MEPVSVRLGENSFNSQINQQLIYNADTLLRIRETARAQYLEASEQAKRPSEPFPGAKALPGHLLREHKTFHTTLLARRRRVDVPKSKEKQISKATIGESAPVVSDLERSEVFKMREMLRSSQAASPAKKEATLTADTPEKRTPGKSGKVRIQPLGQREVEHREFMERYEAHTLGGNTAHARAAFDRLHASMGPNWLDYFNFDPYYYPIVVPVPYVDSGTSAGALAGRWSFGRAPPSHAAKERSGTQGNTSNKSQVMSCFKVCPPGQISHLKTDLRMAPYARHQRKSSYAESSNEKAKKRGEKNAPKQKDTPVKRQQNTRTTGSPKLSPKIESLPKATAPANPFSARKRFIMPIMRNKKFVLWLHITNHPEPPYEHSYLRSLTAEEEGSLRAIVEQIPNRPDPMDETVTDEVFYERVQKWRGMLDAISEFVAPKPVTEADQVEASATTMSAE